MKNIDNVTIAEMQQKLEIIAVRMKLLFQSYQDFVGEFITWKMDDPKEKKSSIKTKLLNDFKTIMHTLDEYAHQVEDNINIVDTIALKVRDSHSVSIMKSMEHKLYKIDQILLQCNTYIFLIDESQITISEVLGYKKESKRILN